MAQSNPYEAPGSAPVSGEIPWIRTKLGIMMFLEFFIWGCWLPLFFDYLPSLGFDSLQSSWILNAFAISSITALFFSNQFADRYFAAEKFLAVSHLIGGVAILAIAWVSDFWSVFGLMLLHSLFYVPTISITNSIAFANLKDPQRDFGKVRLWGTIGWIAASWPFVFILVDWVKVSTFGDVGFIEWLGSVLQNGLKGDAAREGTRWTFIVAGVSSIVLAVFSLMLPHTPPKKAAPGEDSFFSSLTKSLVLLKYPFMLILFIATFIDACVHQGYFVYANSYLKNAVGIPANWVMPVMSIGQIAEILTMAILGWWLKRFGWRTTMIIGILGHAIRFAVFAFSTNPQLAVVVNVLHGICYAFFFATVYIFVDAHFPKDIRTSAQGLFNLLILGVGPFVGNFIWPLIQSKYTTPVLDAAGKALLDDKGNPVTITDFQSVFLYPSITAVVAAVLLLLFFHPPKVAESSDGASPLPH